MLFWGSTFHPPFYLENFFLLGIYSYFLGKKTITPRKVVPQIVLLSPVADLHSKILDISPGQIFFISMQDNFAK